MTQADQHSAITKPSPPRLRFRAVYPRPCHVKVRGHRQAKNVSVTNLGFGVKPLLLASSAFNTQLGWRVFDGKHGNDSVQLYQAYKIVNATGRIGYYEFHTLAQSPFSNCGQGT